MTIDTFATKYRLKITRDECGDKIIQGKRGHLYFADEDGLCLMVTDGAVAQKSRWEALGGKLWLGEISCGVQDVWIKNIPLEHARAAIKMVKARSKRLLSPEELETRRAALVKARETQSNVRKKDQNSDPGEQEGTLGPSTGK